MQETAEQKRIEESAELAVSIRAVLLAAFARGTTTFSDLSGDPDLVRAAMAARGIGAFVDFNEAGASEHLEGTVTGAFGSEEDDGESAFETPLGGWSLDSLATAPVLECGGSKTTAGILLGLLAGYFMAFRLYGNEELSSQPFSPIIRPLILMGARISRATLGCRTGCGIGADWLPLLVKGWSPLKPGVFKINEASALYRDAVLLAGLRAEGTTTVTVPEPVDASIKPLLAQFGVTVEQDGLAMSVEGPQHLSAPEGTISIAQYLS